MRRSICGNCHCDIDSKTLVIISRDLSICFECIEYISAIVSYFSKKTYKKNDIVTIIKSFNEELNNKEDLPFNIFKKLSSRVMGQDLAKKAISVSIANHFKLFDTEHYSKNNIFIIGPTGSGKTELIRSASAVVGVPYLAVDTTQLTPRGIEGMDVDEIMSLLLYKSGGDLDLAEKSIIFLDELDKLFLNHDGDMGKRIQNELLRMIEGEVYQVPYKEEICEISTDKMLFIGSGAFQSAQDMIEENKYSPVEKEKKIAIVPSSDSLIEDDISNYGAFGKGSNTSHNLSEILVEIGVSREFLGRFSVITQTKPLKEEDLFNILKNKKGGIIEQYNALFEKYGVLVEFGDDFIQMVAKKAIKLGYGARGINKIVEEELKEILFNVHRFKNKAIKLTKAGYTLSPPLFKKGS